MANVLRIHERDPNFPHIILERIQAFLEDDDVFSNPEKHETLITEVSYFPTQIPILKCIGRCLQRCFKRCLRTTYVLTHKTPLPRQLSRNKFG